MGSCSEGHPQAHGGPHWDVQRGDGKGYVNRYPDGLEREGSGLRPSIPAPARISTPAPARIDWEPVVAGTVVVVVFVVAVALVPKTGGASLLLLAMY